MTIPVRIAAAVAVAALSVTACSSAPAAPVHSAPAACKNFQHWFLAIGGNVASGKDAKVLAAAVHAAPSGHLYRDLSTLQSDVSTTVGAKGTSLESGSRLMTLVVAQQVESDCQSVNPG